MARAPADTREEVAELRRAKAAAEAASEAKSRFLAGVSHEIRAPLNAIYGYAQLLERSNGADAVRAAKVIRRSSEHLTNLVEGLLDISQIESGTLRVHRDTIRFPALLEQTVAMFAPLAAAKGLDFRFARATALPEFVRGDQKRLRQVLINLLSNAIKFTERGGVTLTVQYRSELAMFEVADTGIGIAAEEIGRIFDPFVRGSGASAQRQPGAGLGLTITQALVRIMGGDIGVESELAKGTRFTVRLMLAQPLAPPADATPAGIVTGYAGPRRATLLVADDPAQLDLLRGLLEPLDFSVTVAGGIGDAIALGTEAAPDLAILDIAAAAEAAAMLRQRFGAALRVILLSADANATASTGDGEAPPAVLLVKPIDLTMLLDVISAQLNLAWIGPAPRPLTDTAASVRQAPPEAGPHLAEIERLVRVGHVRGIEAEIEAIAALAPNAALVRDLRTCLDAFDLKGLAAIARTAQNHAG